MQLILSKFTAFHENHYGVQLTTIMEYIMEYRIDRRFSEYKRAGYIGHCEFRCRAAYVLLSVLIYLY